MKSNPVVFPFTKFSRLSSAPSDNVFVTDKTVSLSDIRTLLLPHKLPSIATQGDSVEEKILSIFLDDEICFGEKTDITDLKKLWISKIQYFTSKKKCLEFTLLGFPGKAPVPLKTNRKLPDFGEVLALNRLHEITRRIAQIYRPGARITVMSEGALGVFIGLSKKETTDYESFLAELVQKLGFKKTIRVIPLGKLKDEKKFSSTFASNKKRFRDLLSMRDRNFIQKFDAALPSIFHLIHVRNTPYGVLQDAYTFHPKTTAGKKERKRIQAKAKQAAINYFAFLKTRDDLGFLETTVPGFLALTVSPKPYRIGIHLISKNTKLLAHHGVPVGTSIEYLHSLRTSRQKFTRVFLQEDREDTPFLYLPYI